MKALYRNLLFTIRDDDGDGVVLRSGQRVSFSDPHLVVDPTDAQIADARIAREQTIAHIAARRADRKTDRKNGVGLTKEYGDGDVFAVLDENRGEESHILWIVCALGVDMAHYKGFFAHFNEWQDAVAVIRDTALWLYEGYNDATVEAKADWDWYLKLEETAQQLAELHNVANEPGRSVLDDVFLAMQEFEEMGGPVDDEYDAAMDAISKEALSRKAHHQKNTAWGRLQHSLEQEPRSFTWEEDLTAPAEDVPCIQTFCKDNDLSAAEILQIKDLLIGWSATFGRGGRLTRVPYVPPTVVVPIKFCPRCGGTRVSADMHDWASRSIEDPGNEASLIEHQCNDCGDSFWTGKGA